MEYYSKNNRKTISQLTDYRIFIVSCYHNNEINSSLQEALKGKVLGDPIITTTKNYTFYKYSIDEYVTSFTINRAMDGNPSSLNFSLFPTFNSTRNNGNGEYDFMYRLNDTLLPIIRRMDYIEVQVATDITIDGRSNLAKEGLIPLKKILANTSKYNTDYTDPDYTSPYKTRFKGFIHRIAESDSADGGIDLNIQADSMLYYLANSPFLTSAALLGVDQRVEGQRIFILDNNYVTIYHDLLHDLRDTTQRVKDMLSQIFRTTPNNSDPVHGTRLEPGSTPVAHGTLPDGTVGYDAYSVANTFSVDLAETGNKVSEILDILAIEEKDGKLESSDTQSGLIQLAEFYIGYMDNDISSNFIFEIFSSDLFDQTITFSSDNQTFISKYLYTLSVLNEFKQSIRYILYEFSDGTISYDRPRFDNPIDVMIPDELYLSYEYVESTHGLATDMFAVPDTEFFLYDNAMKEVLVKSGGGILDQQRRYGYRRPEPIHVPSISSGPALVLFAETEKVVNNSQLLSLSIRVPYDDVYEIGKIVWFRRKNLVGMVKAMSEKITYGGQAITELTISYLRNAILDDSILKKYPNLVVHTTDPYYDISYDLIISNFPEYTFVNDFYSSNLAISNTTIKSPLQEREIYS